MSIASLLLGELDSLLSAKVDLTIYGRAAISLGYADAPPEAALSQDVDAVLWLGQAEDLLTTNFWDAIAGVNARFAREGYFISHLFCEDQVILNPDWRVRRTPIPGHWRNLELSRLGDRDLLLSKLMRADSADQADAEFIFRRSGISLAEFESEIASARVPAIPELAAEFERACVLLRPKLGADRH